MWLCLCVHKCIANSVILQLHLWHIFITFFEMTLKLYTASGYSRAPCQKINILATHQSHFVSHVKHRTALLSNRNARFSCIDISNAVCVFIFTTYADIKNSTCVTLRNFTLPWYYTLHWTELVCEPGHGTGNCAKCQSRYVCLWMYLPSLGTL